MKLALVGKLSPCDSKTCQSAAGNQHGPSRLAQRGVTTIWALLTFVYATSPCLGLVSRGHCAAGVIAGGVAPGMYTVVGGRGVASCGWLRVSNFLNVSNEICNQFNQYICTDARVARAPAEETVAAARAAAALGDAARAAAAMSDAADVAEGGDGGATLETGVAVDVACVARGAIPKMLCVMV